MPKSWTWLYHTYLFVTWSFTVAGLVNKLNQYIIKELDYNTRRKQWTPKKQREIEIPTRLLCRKQWKVQEGSYHQKTALQQKKKTMDTEKAEWIRNIAHRAFAQNNTQTKIQKENNWILISDLFRYVVEWNEKNLKFIFPTLETS